MLHGEKVVSVVHSMGEIVYRAFMHWADLVQPGWVEAHLHATVSIAGPTLGVTKAVSSVLSGVARR